MLPCKTTVTEGGRIIIPAPLRKQLDLHVGDEVIIHLEGQELRIMTLKESIHKAQQLVQRYVPRGRSLTKELAAERRKEAKNE